MVRSMLVINMTNAKGVVIQAGGLFTLRLETYKDVSGFDVKWFIERKKKSLLIADTQVQQFASGAYHPDTEVTKQFEECLQSI